MYNVYIPATITNPEIHFWLTSKTRLIASKEKITNDIPKLAYPIKDTTLSSYSGKELNVSPGIAI